MSDTTTPTTNETTMSKEDIAYFIRTMWEALLIPNWERSDLIDLGMAVFTKTTLPKIDQKKLGRLLPSLSIVATAMGEHIRTKFSNEFNAFLQAQEAAHQAELAEAKTSFETSLKVQEAAHQAELAEAKTSFKTALEAQKAAHQAVLATSASDEVVSNPSIEEQPIIEQTQSEQDLTGKNNE